MKLYKENKRIVELIKDRLINSSINQYKAEERAIIVKRILGSKERVDRLLSKMKKDIVIEWKFSKPYKTNLSFNTR